MKLSDLVSVISLVADLSDPRDETFKYALLRGGVAYSSAGGHGAAFRTGLPLDGVALPADHLAKTLRSLQGAFEEVELEKTSAHRLVLRAGAYRAQFPVLDEAQAAWARDVPTEGFVDLGWDFWSALATASPVIGGSSPNVAHKGAYWSASGQLMATDGHRFTSVSCNARPPGGVGLLVPQDFVKVARSEWKTAALDADGCLWFVTDGSGVWTSLLEGAFPETMSDQLLGKARAAENATTVAVTKEVVAALDRVLAVPRASDLVKVSVVLAEGSLSLSVPEEPGGASAEEAVPAAVEGPGCRVDLNGKFLRHALATFPTMRVTDAKAPVYFFGEGREHLLVPMLF